MKNRHEKMIESAKEWLNTVDRDEFIAEFLELQAESSGPTVDELLSSFENSTDSLFDLTQMSEDCNFIEQEQLQSIESLKISKAIEYEVLDSFKQFASESISYKGKYSFKVKITVEAMHNFQVDNSICSFAEVA